MFFRLKSVAGVSVSCVSGKRAGSGECMVRISYILMGQEGGGMSSEKGELG